MPLTLYDHPLAPSPRRARIFLAEKSISYERVTVDLPSGEHMGEAFRAINPACTVPVLMTEDGTAICENAGIAAYLEAYKPEPPLMGATPTEKGEIAGWNARVEFEGLYAIAEYIRNALPGMKGRSVTGPVDHDQIPALAERGHARTAQFMTMLNERLAGREFIATETFSYADITALVAVDFAIRAKIGPEETHTHINRWHEAVSARPSASA